MRPFSKERFWILPLLAVITLARYTDSLSCYQCGSGGDSADPNIDCLRKSSEILCSNSDDVCYTKHEAGRIEKGCERRDDCSSRHTCCDRDYCNAAGVQGQLFKTGVGKICADINDCVQNEKNMMCTRQSQTDTTKKCLCGSYTYHAGAVCISKSDLGGVCEGDIACKTAHANCDNGTCSCKHHFFQTHTDIPTCMIKRDLNQVCSDKSQCKDNNAACINNHCECKMGYRQSEETYCVTGSGSERIHLTLGLVVATAICKALL